MRKEKAIVEAREQLQQAKAKMYGIEERVERTLRLASLISAAAIAYRTSKEKRREKMLSSMIHDKRSKALSVAVTDSCFRTKNPKRTVEHLRFLISQYGFPAFLPWWQKIGMWLLLHVGKIVPRLVVWTVHRLIRTVTHGIILPGERDALQRYLRERQKGGIQINLNRLGEAILGDNEAKNRLNDVLEDIADPLVEMVSVKISSIYSQINLIAYEETAIALKEHLRTLFRACKQHRFSDLHRYKFLYLDMEEYKDLSLTCDIFCDVLEEEEFLDLPAGIALQSYIPDSFMLQERLTLWALLRRARGGAPIRIRLVKGANLSMEKVEAAIKNWEQAPYHSKKDTDAQFKNMLHFALLPEHIDAVHISVASHNIFDIAYALILKQEYELDEEMQFEMLEGMADPIRQVVQALTERIILYAPCVKKESFHTAIAYLMRRLDENTSKENFLAHLFNLKPETAAWEIQKEHFIAACYGAANVSCIPKREQNRAYSTISPRTLNEPDTDFSLEANRAWAETIRKEWYNASHEIPLMIGGEERRETFKEGIDPSTQHTIHRYAIATEQELEEALTHATNASFSWAKMPTKERAARLKNAAYIFRKRRKELLGAMLQETAKTIQESDPEVSEAIDFIEYYAHSLLHMMPLFPIVRAPKTTAVVSPWNFPCSIPTGGIAAALACGSSVLFKPASEAVLVGWIVAQCFWEAGIPKEVLQFIPTEDEPYGSLLIKDERISQVILTGATETARHFLKLRTTMPLFAETGGKNTLIVSDLADRDLAVRDIIQSAFGYAGQKCSACSVAILHEEVFYDRSFQKQLADATSSLCVDSVWNPQTKIGPLIRPPSPHLLTALTNLEEKESWLVQPRASRENPHLWSPGIKWNVQPGSVDHTTEFFGPLLSVICAKNLDDAVNITNATRYGLTAGLHSLDKREHEIWRRKVEAGNLYINRTITGAVVGRQPFGGTKASSFGIGMKAGGPNYLFQFLPKIASTGFYKSALTQALLLLEGCVNESELTQQEKDLWKATAMSYAYWWKHHFSKRLHRGVMGEENFLYYVTRTQIFFILQEQDSLLDIFLVFAAAATCGAELIITQKEQLPTLRFPPTIQKVLTLLDWQLSPYETLIGSLGEQHYAHVRMLTKPDTEVAASLAPTIFSLNIASPHLHGRVELLRYVREVAVSYDYHRYGNLLRSKSMDSGI